MGGHRPRIAFYAPIKPPDHPTASGDREIARLTVAALERAGYAVELASRYISYSKRSDDAELAKRLEESAAEVERIRAEWQARDAARRPGLFLTYHPYCKAPDLVGPPLSSFPGIPYVTLEACRTNQGTDDEWRPWREIVTASIRQAAMNFCLTPTDRRYLESILADRGKIRDIRPFVDADSIARADPLDAGGREAVPRLIAVGMMRPGAKMESFRLLADALGRIADRAWTLLVVGDGPGRAEVESLFSAFDAGRILLVGAEEHKIVIGRMRAADIFVWPGTGEAIGMVYLEAQAAGLPVVAQATAGVPQAVDDGVTGILSPEGDANAMADAIATLLADDVRRRRMGEAARAGIARERDIAQAAAALKTALAPLLPAAAG